MLAFTKKYTLLLPLLATSMVLACFNGLYWSMASSRKDLFKFPAKKFLHFSVKSDLCLAKDQGFKHQYSIHLHYTVMLNERPLVNEPYLNGFTLREQNLSYKSCCSFELILCTLKKFRSFHRCIVSLCRSKGCKVTVCQTSKMIPSTGSQT